MILQILQQVWQVAGPQLIQLVNNPTMLQNVAPQIVRGGYFAGKIASDVYTQLSPEQKEKLQATAAWAAKDLAGDIIDTTIGLPIGSFLVDKTMALFEEDQDVPKDDYRPSARF
jgi:hypothetical protein